MNDSSLRFARNASLLLILIVGTATAVTVSAGEQPRLRKIVFLAGAPDGCGELHILARGLDAARGMVVGQYEPQGEMLDRGVKDLPRVCSCRVQRPDRYGLSVDELVLRVQVEPAEVLLARPADVPHFPEDVLRSAELGPLGRSLANQPPVQFDCRGKARCSGLAYGWHRAQLRERQSFDPGQTVAPQEPLGTAFGIRTEDQGNEFGRRECRGPATLELLPQRWTVIHALRYDVEHACG